MEVKPVQARCVNAASASRLDVNVKSKSLSQSSKLKNVISMANAVGDFLTRPSKPLTEHEERKNGMAGYPMARIREVKSRAPITSQVKAPTFTTYPGFCGGLSAAGHQRYQRDRWGQVSLRLISTRWRAHLRAAAAPPPPSPYYYYFPLPPLPSLLFLKIQKNSSLTNARKWTLSGAFSPSNPPRHQKMPPIYLRASLRPRPRAYGTYTRPNARKTRPSNISPSRRSGKSGVQGYRVIRMAL